jgi:RNA 2',3'-cyclic 3'-phosphodiesterase
MARVRTFIGVEVGEDIRDNATALQQVLAKTGAAVNWTPPGNLHLTLLFLGEVDDRDLPAVCRIVAEAAATEPPFTVRVSGVEAFPNARRPKTLWAGVTDGTAELIRLHDAMEQPLLELGCYRREERAYTPHLTLGRVKSDEAGNRLAPELPKHLGWDGGQTMVTEVVLFSSELRRDGPEYTALGRGALRG